MIARYVYPGIAFDMGDEILASGKTHEGEYYCPDCGREITFFEDHDCNGIDQLQTEMLRLEATASRIQQIYNTLPDEIKASLKFRIEFDNEKTN